MDASKDEEVLRSLRFSAAGDPEFIRIQGILFFKQRYVHESGDSVHLNLGSVFASSLRLAMARESGTEELYWKALKEAAEEASACNQEALRLARLIDGVLAFSP